MQGEVVFDDVMDAQRHFRVIMDCMARPGKIGQLAQINIELPASLNNASAAVGFSLLDSNASFCSVGRDNNEISSCFLMNTDATRATVDRADFVFIEGVESNFEFNEVKLGSLSYPDDSATIVVSAEELSNQGLDDSLWVTLKGPGIKTETELYIKGITKDLLKATIEANLEFPLGADLILTDKSNRICCIPRSSHIHIN